MKHSNHDGLFGSVVALFVLGVVANLVFLAAAVYAVVLVLRATGVIA